MYCLRIPVGAISCSGASTGLERLETDPDQIILARVRLGDTNAFAELVEKYKQPITQFAARMLGDQIEAQDVAQNVFVQEISEVLGQSLSAVKSLIHRARQKLRRKLAPCISYGRI